MIEKGETWRPVPTHGPDGWDVDIHDPSGQRTGCAVIGVDRATANNLERLVKLLDATEEITELAMAGCGENREQERKVEAVIRLIADIRTGRNA